MVSQFMLYLGSQESTKHCLLLERYSFPSKASLSDCNRDRLISLIFCNGRVPISVTRLGDFLNFFVLKFSYKSPNIVVDFWAIPNYAAYIEKMIWPLLGTIGKNWATFYSIIWSQWSHAVPR